ncbi:putative FAD-binding monooxygenase [Lasiosphaeria ovina]|uniref:FAD-binding monooxygenase n=1 Tax=Lasiosphaeria ovina TaxID=92902 RepID=A0AAE0KG88_9PEZI|nr:putative FAD-binding monooxygenase [Lasiosphaeria ovina]
MLLKAPEEVLKVAIIGGGPGGLSTAIALSQIANVDVRLYEQASVLREVGAGISIGQNSWNVLELLGVADTLTSGHVTATVLNLNGKTGEEVHRMARPPAPGQKHANIRTQRTQLQSALLAHVKPGVIQLSKKLARMTDKGADGVELVFEDGTAEVADLVVGADGIRSVVRDSAWPEYELKFTGTTIWRALLSWDAVVALDERFATTGWWHGPTTHVWLSPVGDGLGEIAARAWHDPAVHSASKVSWGVPVGNEHVESHFPEYLPQIRAALAQVKTGDWREFAAFAGPELDRLTAWDGKVVLVGDASHALSGAFGSGAGFAMEDGWVLAQALQKFNNDTVRALQVFDAIRLPYYGRMYSHLAAEAAGREAKLVQLRSEGVKEGDEDGVSYDDRVRVKVIKGGGKDMSWIYANDIGAVWRKAVEGLEEE